MSVKKKAQKNSAKTTKKKSTKKVIGRPFQKGQSGNPGGRPKGARDRRTVIWEALKVIAKEKKASPEEIEELIQMTGINLALRGNFSYYDAITDGLYGKQTQPLEHDATSTFADLIKSANNGNKTGGGTKA